MLIGRLHELKRQARDLQIQIDVQVKGIIVHFEPLDCDLEYTRKINPHRLEVCVQEIKEKKIKLDKILLQIEQIKEDTGEDELE